RRGQDRQELIRLERGATDQPAIDIGHRKYICRIARLDAAAVEDARRAGNFSIPLPDPRPDESVDLLRLIGRCVTSRADGPDRLVGDHAGPERACAAELEHRIELTSDHLLSPARIAIGELLPDAKDRHEALGVRSAELTGN